MELNWSTFVLELINLAVLIWILQHFFYKPVLGVIKKRQDGINKTLADSKALNQEAATLKQQYENRLSVWETERQHKLEMLHQEMEVERAKRMESHKVSLDAEREKVRVVNERRLLEAQRKNEEAALAQGARFSALLLSRLASPELENRIFDLLIEALSTPPPERVDSLRSAGNQNGTQGLISSAFEVKGEYRKNLEAKLNVLIGHRISFRYQQDSELLAGFRITLGPWVFRANLQDELKSFTETAHVA